MNLVVARLIPRVLVAQSACSVAGLVLFLGVAPDLLHVDTGHSLLTFEVLLASWVTASLLALVATYRRIRRYRSLLRSLAFESSSFEASDLADLSLAPAYVALTFAGLSALLAFAPSLLLTAHGDQPGTLVLLSIVTATTVALPLYVFVRGLVARAIELAPPETSQQALASLEARGVPRRYELLHMTAAIAVPVFIVATGAALVAFVHVQEACREARRATATALARSLFDVVPVSPSPAFLQQAIPRLALRGFNITFSPALAESAVGTELDGRMMATVPLSRGHASVAFHAVPRSIIAPGVALPWAVALAAGVLIGFGLGLALVNDLALAAGQVRSLGKEGILRGSLLTSGGLPRFAVVARLGEAIEVLTQRFRTFAEAQERALAARRASLRLRSLLFASVSHDLKSPLNAILGFCAVASAEPLSEPQLDSLRIIERRGRELLALLETILDSARVEARRLTLEKIKCDVGTVMQAAVARGDDLGPVNAVPVELTVEANLPEVFWDDVRVAQAIAALIGHAKRLCPDGGVQVEVRRRSASTLRVTVTEPSDAFSPTELAHLLDATHATTVPKRMGGLALGLSLARSLIVMHGGSLDVRATPASGGSFFEMVLPLRA